MASETSKKKVKKKVDSHGTAFIRATFNNTIITITDGAGNVVGWTSSGKAGYKGARKSMPYAATTAAEQLARTITDYGMRSVEVTLKGGGAGREAAIRGLKAGGLDIKRIVDRTSVPHNGCRPRKRRRV
ncbi:MAG: 30S ribosomal protein S11 [Fibrobacterota bacterium]